MTTTSDIDEHHPKSIINMQPKSAPLTFFPVHVADFLFDNYVNRVAPQYPIHYTPDLIAMHRAAFHETDANGNPRGATAPYDVFTLNLIMAISLSTAARSNQARANAIASGLFEKAMEHISEVLSNDLRGLQALIILTQYTFLNPGVANFWLLTGFISQACIDMGLHHELPDHPDVSALDRDMRRRVFWCAWEMEIAVCGALLRPITLLRRTITTKFPSQLEDTAFDSTGVNANARSTKFTSQFIWRYRQVECDIVPVLFHDEPIPAEFPSLEDWISHQERTILSWKAEIHQSCSRNTDPQLQLQWDEMKLYSDIATDYILVTLFRPCPRIKDPPADNLLKAFSAAVGVADGSWRQANLEFGSSKYVFHACYHSFSAAITFMQALQRIKTRIFATHTWEQVQADMETFSRFFATVAERWPAASRCLEEYERLLGPIKQEVAEFLAHSPSTMPDNLVSWEPGTDTGSFLEEALNFNTFFNMMTPGLGDTVGGYLSTPMDWDDFSFDFRQDGL